MENAGEVDEGEGEKMLGAIFGDIVGSVYEWNNTKRVDFPLLSKCMIISLEPSSFMLSTELT